MTIAVPDPTVHTAYKTGAMALALAVAAILGAMAFEYIGGYPPCPLCLEQRYAYYAGIPLLFAALVVLSAGEGRWAALLFAVVALAFLANAGLGAYHAGAEWGFWPGPDSCTGAQAITSNAGGLLDSLKTTNVIRCDEAAVRVMGISLAGWNAVASLVLFAMGTRAAIASLRTQ